MPEAKPKLPELPRVDSKMCLPYSAIRYVAGYAEIYVNELTALAQREAWNAAIEWAAKQCDRMRAVSAVSYETGAACAAAIRLCCPSHY